ncbi:protein-tyrosine phosphatase [Capronia epimyces CBS 606.96]|uniref:phosphatidylinositol-3,4,5-trisphosphate 3-phosphatase n=1 Tax=Capronia epimyces CBS 606.96 TaxID=1182542 RepID=W9YWF0_9EURO|nr:protein-tyrosine phosphatase [Capronia epimyces CBS 606.96]EXJ86609.1 protein-tyrosine phosphatase [Capronia epimyces CBS 606.96]
MTSPDYIQVLSGYCEDKDGHHLVLPSKASILRQIVAGPRIRHPEAKLDLCYVTDYIVVTSGPSSLWPKKAYRNPLDQLVGFLDNKHGQEWEIFEFRAEGTGYPDSEVYNRIHHFPWPDHHPPPFAIIPNVMASMRNWIKRLDEDTGNDPQEEDKKKKRVAVIHCKAGKGRSGTVVCSYLISEEGWKKEDALERFTARRMRAGFGHGVSIPSQLRWVGYVDRWANQMGKTYVERPVEIVEIHVYGLRDGVKVSVDGYVDNGRRIQTFHTFNRHEKTVVEEGNGSWPSAPPSNHESPSNKDDEMLSTPVKGTPQSSSLQLNHTSSGSTQTVILKPSSPVILPTSDINIDFERRNKAGYAGFTVVTALAHVWFNAYFEGGHEGDDSGVFAIEWDAMDGIKGSYRKGTKALDRLKVVWKYAKKEGDSAPLERVITQPREGEPVPESQPADWRGDDGVSSAEVVDSGHSGGAALQIGAMIDEGVVSMGKRLGLRKSHPDSANLSRASSPVEDDMAPVRKNTEIRKAEDSEDEGVKVCGPGGEDQVSYDDSSENELPGHRDANSGEGAGVGLGKAAHILSQMKPGNKSEEETQQQSEGKHSA